MSTGEAVHCTSNLVSESHPWGSPNYPYSTSISAARWWLCGLQQPPFARNCLFKLVEVYSIATTSLIPRRVSDLWHRKLSPIKPKEAAFNGAVGQLAWALHPAHNFVSEANMMYCSSGASQMEILVSLVFGLYLRDAHKVFQAGLQTIAGSQKLNFRPRRPYNYRVSATKVQTCSIIVRYRNRHVFW